MSMNRKLLLALLFAIPAMGFSQNDNYGKFTAANGTVIKGTSLARKYENQVEVMTLSSTTSNNITTVQFSMPASAASNSFRSAMNGNEKLQSADITTVKNGSEGPQVVSNLLLKGLKVTACTDNGSTTTVTLEADSADWNYAQYDKSGRRIIAQPVKAKAPVMKRKQ